MRELHRNPFPGLRSFEPNEEHLFFGREKQIDDLLTRLRLTRFLTVVGYSGSGKSSLVRSGLIPALLSGYMAGTGASWRISVMRPGNDPLGNLASCLYQPVAFDAQDDELFESEDEVLEAEGSDEDLAMRVAMMRATLSRSSQGLVNAATQLDMEEGQKLLVVVDQFEELFRFKRQGEGNRSSDQAMAFVNVLLRASEQKEVPVFVVLTMRSDFLENCTELNGLAEAINEGQYLVPRMDRGQRRSAITGPIAVSGTRIAPRLVLRLLNDVGDNPDQLPIMQHALMRTWDYWFHNHDEDEAIDLRHYEAVGTMSEALSQHAEEAYQELVSTHDRTCARKVFTTLTEKGEDGRGIRRPTTIADICSISLADVADVTRVIDRFRTAGRCFLFPPEGVALTPETMLDISHESLMRVWTRLRDWVEEESQSARLYQSLAEAAQRYQTGATGLYRDPELQMAQRWKEQTEPNCAWASRYDPSFERAMTYLERSQEEKERDQGRWKRVQKQRMRRARLFMIVLLLFTLLATGLLVFSLFKADEAEREKNLAEEKRKEAVDARREAEKAHNIIVQQKNEAIRLRDASQRSAREAEDARLAAEEHLADAQAAQRRAIQEKNRAEQARLSAEKARQDADSARAQAVAEHARARTAEVEAMSNLERSRVLMILNFAHELAGMVPGLQQKDPQLAALAVLRAFELFRTYTPGDDLLMDPLVQESLRQAASGLNADLEPSYRFGSAVRVIIRQGRWLYCGNDDGALVSFDLNEEHLSPITIAHLPGAIRSLAAHPTRPMLAVGTLEGEVYLIEREPGDALLSMKPVQRGRSKVGALCFFAAGKQLAWATPGTLNTCDLLSGETVSVEGFGERIYALAAHPIDDVLVVGSDRGLASVDMKQLIGHLSTDSFPGTFLDDEVTTALAFSKDGTSLAVGLARGEIHLRQGLRLGKPAVALLGHLSSVNGLTYSEDGKLLASAGSDHTLRLWHPYGSVGSSVTLRGHRRWVWGLAFGIEDRKLFSVSADESVIRWIVPTSDLASGLAQYLTRNMTPLEWSSLVEESTTEEERRIIGDALDYERNMIRRSPVPHRISGEH